MLLHKAEVLTMARNVAFYEQLVQLGEVTQSGLRYRMYFDPDSRLTISVLVPGQQPIIDTTRR